MQKFLMSLAAVAVVALAFASYSVAEEQQAAAKLGAPAPTFALQDQDGKTVNLADYKGKVVVLEWFNNDCPYVVKHYSGGNMNAVASKYADKGVVWLAINSTNDKTNADNKTIAGEWKIDRPILQDSSGDVGKAYGAKNTPTMYVIDKDGKLVYWGGIDNNASPDPKTIDGATNYVAKALDEVLDGKSVSEPKTKPYGCGVKYAK